MSIETFELVKEVCLLAHINTREEKHGKESKKGYDLKLVADMHNSVLLKFHPELRSAFYKPDPTRDLVDPDNMPHLRMPMIPEIAYSLEIPRALLRIHDPDDAQNDFVMGGGKINNFKFVMKNGGSVQVTFRVQFSAPDEEEMFKAYRVEFQKVRISLACEEEEKKGDNFEQVENVGQEPMSPAREKAESLFDKTVESDPDFREVKGEAPQPKDGDVVDATFVAAAAPAASSVTSISKGRGKRTATGGATVE